MGDARQFRQDIERWVTNELPKIAAERQKMVLAELFTTIVQATPVGNATTWKANVERAKKGLPALPKGYVGGQARRNWQIGVGFPSPRLLDGVDPSGQQTIGDAFAVLAQIRNPSTFWISNPLPYINALENGWSKQAPLGMVSQAIAAVTAKYGGRR